MDDTLSSEVQECLRDARQGYDTLHLNYQGLHDLPAELFDSEAYKHVSKIHAKRNRLQRLPESIGIITSLRELYLHSNNIKHLPKSIGRLSNLISVDLSFNALTCLPETLCDLPSLEILAVSHNKLTHLPHGLSKIKELRVVDLINNDLTSVPLEIARCPKLQRLMVDRNKLTWLPRQISHMNCLEEISATGNKLLCLPLDLGYMPTLKSVFVDNNKALHAIPLSVQSQGIGFNSCGSINHSSNSGSSVEGEEWSVDSSSIAIKHDEHITKVIYLPPEITTVNTKQNCVVPLLELAIRELHKFTKLGKLPSLEKDDLPYNLLDFLQGPTASCCACQRSIFNAAFPIVFEGQVRVYSLYYLGLCCSLNCIRMASLLIQLPVVYPDSMEMAMAVALVV